MEPTKKFFIILASIIAVLAIGIAGFAYFEGYTFSQAAWLTITTLSTVGYGDIVPKTPEGRAFNMLFIVGGVALVAYAVGSLIGLVLEGQLSNVMGRKRMLKKINNIEKHVIVCGAGRVGYHVIQRLMKEKVPFVVIDQDEEIIGELLKDNFLALEGDATDDKNLLMAGIERANGLVASLPDDADNLFLTMTGKGLNPKIQVVARADRPDSESKLLRAGADKVISPSVIGGRRMAISILKPASVEFVETLMHASKMEIEIEEIHLQPASPLVGKKLRDSQIKNTTGAMVVAIQRGDDIISNPGAEEVMKSKDLLIVIGTRNQLNLLESMAAGNA